MAMSLERWEKEDQTGDIRSNTYHMVQISENRSGRYWDSFAL